MKSRTLSRLLLSLATTFSLAAPLAANASGIVGGWYGTTGVGLGGVFTFLSNGTYYSASDADAMWPVDMERGTYNWNAATGALNMTSIVDMDSPPGPLSPINAQVSGNTMTTNTPFGTLTRAVDPNSPIVGSWHVGAPDNSSGVVVTFLSNGYYFEADDGDHNGSSTSQKGVDIGTYSWDSLTGAFSATKLVDSNGSWGITEDMCNKMQVSGNT